MTICNFSFLEILKIINIFIHKINFFYFLKKKFRNGTKLNIIEKLNAKK